MAALKALLHFDESSPAHAEARQEYKASMQAVHQAEKLLVERVRTELRFDSKKLPRIQVKTGISGVSEIVTIDGKKVDREG